MSVDLRIIIGHVLSVTEIIEFPLFLRENSTLKQIYCSEDKSKLEFNYSTESIFKKIEERHEWLGVSEEDLLYAWHNNEMPALVDENGYICCTLTTYFGFITFNKNSITVLYIPEHKYSNLLYEPQRNFILKFSKALAELLGQDKIIYCSDTHPTEQIERWSYEGLSVDSIIERSIRKFGMHSKVIEQAIEPPYFIEYTTV